jgi:hypothetical protein
MCASVAYSLQNIEGCRLTAKAKIGLASPAVQRMLCAVDAYYKKDTFGCGGIIKEYRRSCALSGKLLLGIWCVQVFGGGFYGVLNR